MGLFAAFFVAVCGLFTFTSTQIFHDIGRELWGNRAREAAVYRPARVASMSDQDGYAHRTADNMALTRRDRGRELWERGPQNPSTFRGWLAETFHTAKPAPFPSSPEHNSSPVYNFSPKSLNPNLHFGSHLEDVPESVAPAVLPAPQVPQPLHEYQMETLPVPMPAPALARPVSLGRKIRDAIQSDEALSKASKLSLKVSETHGKVLLTGLVLNEETKQAIGSPAREIAGDKTPVENRIIVLKG